MEIDEQTKQQVKDDLVHHLRTQGAETDVLAGSEARAAQPDEDSEHRVDDVAQADEAGELHGLFEGVSVQQAALVAHAADLDVSAKDAVAPGAIVVIDGDRFIVGIATDEFTSGGVSYTGISTDAPIYAAIEGKKAGESVTFEGREQRLDAVG